MTVPESYNDDGDLEKEAARVEIDRLNAMKELELAVEVMKAWGTRGAAAHTEGEAGSRQSFSQVGIADWLMRDYPAGRGLLPLMRRAVREACELLVDADMLEQREAAYASSPDSEAAPPAGQLRPTSRGAAIVADGGLNRWAMAYARDRAGKRPASSRTGGSTAKASRSAEYVSPEVLARTTPDHQHEAGDDPHAGSR